MTTLEKILVSIGVLTLIIATVTGFIGWYLDSEFLFNLGLSVMLIILPVYAIIAFALSALIRLIKKDK